MMPARLAAIVAISLAALGGAVAQTTPPKIADWLPLLPTEVFDNTTEGIESDELAVLVKTGNSENWKARAVSDVRYVATAKRPFSEVNMTARIQGSTAFLEVLTYNEKAINYSYWVPAAKGEPLKSWQPSLVYRALNETGDRRGGPAEAEMPADLRDALVRLDVCAQPAGDPKAQTGMRQQICGGSKGVFDNLRKRYRGKAPWNAVIDRADRMTGG